MIAGLSIITGVADLTEFVWGITYTYDTLIFNKNEQYNINLELDLFVNINI